MPPPTPHLGNTFSLFGYPVKLSHHAKIVNGCIEAIRDVAGRVTDDELGFAAGVSRSHMTNIRRGNKRLSFDGLYGLCREYGADVVLGPIAARFGCRVVRNTVDAPDRSLMELALEAAEPMSRVQAAVLRMKDGSNVETVRELRKAMQAAHTALNEMEAVLSAGEEE